ncbi:MAG: hypothetical protein QOE97_762 [Pseudonocardiales bacterium]|nr:hypothetical protein [Pseudonocardiales bacterium]
MVSAIHPVTAERIARHGFVDRAAADTAAGARRTTAIQAQDPIQSRLGIRSRSAAATEIDVLAAIEPDRTVVRTWLMRATIHLVAADDVRWLTHAVGPSFARRFRKRWLDIGLTPEVLARTVDAMPDVLANGPRTRREIVEGLENSGVSFDMTDPQAPTHVLAHASGLGLLCRGPERGRDSTFVLLDDWLPRAAAGPRGDDALAELARRYFAAFSPATVADFATWSGLPSARAVQLIRDELEPADVGGRPGFRAKQGGEAAPATDCVRLVAGFDNYLVGYRHRELLIADEHRAAVYVGGVIKPTVLVDGRIVATWRLSRSQEAATVTVLPLVPLAGAVRDAIAEEVADLGRFVAQPARLSIG